MKRYLRHEVDAAIYATRRGMFTPHDQIVLAAEVQVLRDREYVRRLLRGARSVLERVRAHLAKKGTGTPA